MQLPYERKVKELDNNFLINKARQILEDEANALLDVSNSLDESIAKAARLVSAAEGRLIVSGIGKSGHVGRKSAATFASLGVPSFFVHSTEAYHGDLGMICKGDIGYFLSNSGETREVITLVPHFKALGCPIIAVTGNPASTLAKSADVVLNCHVDHEADPLGLAPTSSTTVQIALGDAVAGLATFLLDMKKEDFAVFHPGGSLGKRLLLRVTDIMVGGDDVPITNKNKIAKDALFDITSKGLGATAIVDDDGKLLGIFTDGDLRRVIEKYGLDGLEMSVDRVMTCTPKTISPTAPAVVALNTMQKYDISVLVVTEGEKPVGMIHLHDILKAGVA
ncbi:MAG: KpsF/GutQ family sugar-phosphate isomerase [Synergistaceae bacterium]|nr:KpsF/GutQ family sugar-phosphate isomerase [Synergistaceae bacterium]